jgi:thiamine pyrophosphate-dependent acetolactate synthase large subunit-like protein
MTSSAQISSGLDRREAIPKLFGDPKEFLIIAGLAGAAKDIGELTKEAPNTFLFGGSMGGATMTGLGLALAQPDRRVVVVTGDGDLLMSMGSLATIGIMKPKNLVIVCVDNEIYGETGSQATHTGQGVDLKVVADGCGIPITHEVTNEAQIAEASRSLRRSNGPVFILLKVNGNPPPPYRRNWHAHESKSAFRRALLGKR